MMREVMSRRFARVQKEDPDRERGQWPDLVMIDGGAGQLAATESALADLGIDDVALVAIAKGPDRDAGRERLLQAALGLVQLRYVDDEVASRKRLAQLYREHLASISGISVMAEPASVTGNYGYFPIFVDEPAFGMSRDGLYERLKGLDIFGRRYFYPLISDFPCYRDLGRASLPWVIYWDYHKKYATNPVVASNGSESLVVWQDFV
jgi:hypothetical protein